MIYSTYSTVLLILIIIKYVDFGGEILKSAHRNIFRAAHIIISNFFLKFLIVLLHVNILLLRNSTVHLLLV